MPDPDTPVTATSRPSGMRTSTPFRLCRLAFCTSMRRSFFATGAARLQRMLQRLLQEPAGERGRLLHELLGRAFGDHLAAELARAGAEIDHVLRAADRVLVVLDHDERVALRVELLQRVEQDAVVARVQADRRLVEDVADAAQVGAELRREPDALRLAARERRRRAVEREVAEADLARGSRAARSARPGCRARSRFPSFKRQLVEEARSESTGCARTARRSSPPKRTASASGFRRCPSHSQARRSRSRATRSTRARPRRLLARRSHRRRRRGRCRSTPRTSRASSCTRTGADRAREAAAARGAGALGREHLRLDLLAREHVHDALADLERAWTALAQLGLGRRRRRSPTGSSMVCSLKRSRRGQGRVGSSLPSTRRCQ